MGNINGNKITGCSKKFIDNGRQTYSINEKYDIVLGDRKKSEFLSKKYKSKIFDNLILHKKEEAPAPAAYS